MVILKNLFMVLWLVQQVCILLFILKMFPSAICLKLEIKLREMWNDT